MKTKASILLFTVLLFLTLGLIAFTGSQENERIVSYTVNLKKQSLQLYWKDEQGVCLKSIANLKQYVARHQSILIFAMNGGMYTSTNTPQGLFIQAQKTLSPLDTGIGSGNFYLQPNGVFYTTTDHRAFICRTADFVASKTIQYATQSGPMLIINGQLHPAFKEGSTNVNIRNGVGILPNHNIVFAMSKTAINFYDFARYFQQLGCKQALYLDGYVSRTYLPEQNWVQTDGNFGVMIGVTVKSK